MNTKPMPDADSKSLTPRTDALVANPFFGSTGSRANDAVALCKAVERELTEESARVESLHKIGYALQEHAEAAERELAALRRVGEAAKGWLIRYEDEVRDPSEEAPCKELVAAVDALILGETK